MPMKHCALLLAFISLTGCSSPVAPQSHAEIADVSLIRLLASPDRYEGKLVRVSGFVRLQFEGNAIYLHQEDFQHHLTSNGLWLGDVKCVGRGGKDVKSGYAIVEGKFTATSRGHMNLWSGELSDVQRCVELP